MNNFSRYPVFETQPNCGPLPNMWQMGPSDTRPSSGPSPYYKGRIAMQYGRHLAGLGNTESPLSEKSDMGEPAFASNELEFLAEMDDVQGNGIFDPPGSHPNIHPDAGMFAMRGNLPGYAVREKPFGFSEVRDVTTGRPIRVVPGGAVAMDSAAQIAFVEQGAYAAPQPIIDAPQAGRAGFKPIWNVVQNPIAIGADAPPATTTTTETPISSTLLKFLAVGVVAGVGIAIWKKGKRK